MTQDDCWQQAQVEAVGHAIRELRGDRSTQWISDQTAELGQRVGRSTITDIEIGRRKYVAVHELSLIAAALGVTPSTLLTYGTLPDGECAVLPGRTVPGLDAAGWWGGEMLNPFLDSTRGIPRDDVTAQLMRLSRQRAELRTSLFRAQLATPTPSGEKIPPDAAFIVMLRERLSGVEARIRDLGGVLREEPDASG
jgi:transcriptional regulator with XRE-family HTH domain